MKKTSLGWFLGYSSTADELASTLDSAGTDSDGRTSSTVDEVVVSSTTVLDGSGVLTGVTAGVSVGTGRTVGAVGT